MLEDRRDEFAQSRRGVVAEFFLRIGHASCQRGYEAPEEERAEAADVFLERLFLFRADSVRGGGHARLDVIERNVATP